MERFKNFVDKVVMGDGHAKTNTKSIPNSTSSPLFPPLEGSTSPRNINKDFLCQSADTPYPPLNTSNEPYKSLPTSKSLTFKTSKEKKPKTEKKRGSRREKRVRDKEKEKEKEKEREKEKEKDNDAASELRKKKGRSFTKKLLMFESTDKIHHKNTPQNNIQNNNNNIPIEYNANLNEGRRSIILEKSEQALSSSNLTGTQNIMNQVLYQNPLQNSTRNIKKLKRKSKSDDISSNSKKIEILHDIIGAMEEGETEGENKGKIAPPVPPRKKASISSIEKNEKMAQLPSNSSPNLGLGGGYLNKPIVESDEDEEDDNNNSFNNNNTSDSDSDSDNENNIKKSNEKPRENIGGGYLQQPTNNNNNNNNNQNNKSDKEKKGKENINKGEEKPNIGGGYLSPPPKKIEESDDNDKTDSEKDKSGNSKFDTESNNSWSGFENSSDEEVKPKKTKPQNNSKKEVNKESEDEETKATNVNFLSTLLGTLSALNPDDLKSLGGDILQKYPKFADDLSSIIEDFKAEKKLIEGDDDDEEFFSDSSDDDEKEQKEDIDHLLDVSCNWNQRFQVCIEMLKHHGQIHEKRVQIFLHLSNLAQDFIHCAKTYGRIIISEAETPIESKTIKPTHIGGFAGGDKYIVNNIMFKFAVDSHNLFDVEEAAIKIAGHDLKGLISYFNLGIEGLHFPLMALVDYLGYRLIAMSVLPIGKNTIVYGSSDAGRSIHNSCAILSYKMQFAAKMLNLKKHKVGKEKETLIEMFSAADLEGHDVDGVFYLLDFSRTFPPTAYDDRYRNSYLYRLFRSEFVKNYSTSLCPDTFSGFVSEGAEEHIKEVEEATAYLKNQTIPKFAAYLNSMEDREVDKLNLKEVLHESGINLRYLGNLRHEVKREDIKQMILVEMVARIIKHELRSKMRQQMRELKLPLEHSCREMVIDHLNLVFGKTPESEEHFNHSIKEHLLRNFEEALTEKEKESPLKGLLTGKKRELFIQVQQMTNLIFTSSAQNEFANKENAFEFENPFHVTDLDEIGVRVRHLNIVALAQGYVLKNQARKCQLDEKNSERLCKLALEKFKQALSDNPGDIRALRELADASNILGDKEAADMYYKRATTISNDANTLFKYAVFLEENRKIQEAEEYYLLTLEKDLKHDHCFQRYGHFLENQGNPESAEQFFIRASEIRSRSSHQRQPSGVGFLTPNFLF